LFGWGIYSVQQNPIDAIPDLSENQVIVFTEWMGRSPQVIEDQVTYPLVSNLQGIPKSKTCFIDVWDEFCLHHFEDMSILIGRELVF
jgi:Cu/Ag efflux pump CusA